MTFSCSSNNLQAQIDAYFDNCREQSQPIRVSGLAEHLGIDQSVLRADRDGKHLDDMPHELVMAVLEIEIDTMQRGLRGVNPEQAIRDLVENHGYQE